MALATKARRTFQAGGVAQRAISLEHAWTYVTRASVHDCGGHAPSLRHKMRAKHFLLSLSSRFAPRNDTHKRCLEYPCSTRNPDRPSFQAV